MKKENKESVKNNRRYLIYGCTYVAFCFITLAVCVFIMNDLIARNNVNQMNETIGLIAEKVNVSFDVMSRYVEQQAGVLSVQENLNFEDEYKMLQNMVSNMDYISVGMIDKQGSMYCKEGEKVDIAKYEYGRNALEKKALYITEPYLSCVTGSNVITMFAPIYQKREFSGSLFVTYPLECVQKLAETNVLKHDVESYLMNGLSANYITCSGSANHSAGVWGNLSLIKGEMTCSDGYDYNSWFENMSVNSDDNVLCYELGGVEYTQAFVKINSMENWYVVVRIPNIELTNTMHQYLRCLSFSATVLIVGTLVFAFLLYFNEYRQKKKIEVISEYDPLTNLLNRRAFSNKLKNISSDVLSVRNSIYIFVDIDFFKEVNDNYGHAAGDEILQQVAAALDKTFSSYGYVSRIGGDEFNVFLPDMKSRQEVEELIKNYEADIKNIVLSDGTALPVQCSIGVAKYVNGTDSIESLTTHADEALYYIKKNGKNNFCWYSDIQNKNSN